MEPWWRAPLTEVFSGRRVLLVGERPQAWSDHIAHLRSVGVGDLFLLATGGDGVGAAPDVPTFLMEPPDGLSMMERIRHGNTVLADLPRAAVDALDAFDPERQALAVGSFLNEVAEIDGRPFLAHRRPEWVALEDKTVVDGFWDAAGVDRAPSEVVALDRAATVAADLDRGAGTVWAADARDGFHGGAHGTFRVVDEASRVAATQALEPMCDRVRVMPFLEGVPCSIHGIVLPDGTVALRPVELVTLRRGADLVYAGCATFWDPADDVREQMRQVTLRAGEQLRRQVGFRGTFTVDGVVGEGGFLPTELNPRFGAGIMTIARAAGLPILLMNEIVVGGHPIGRSAEELEHDLLAVADEVRGGGTWIPGAVSSVDVAGRHVTERDGSFAWAQSGEEVAASVDAGIGFVRCVFEPGAVPVGPSVGPRAAAFWEFADRVLGTSVGPLTAAVP